MEKQAKERKTALCVPQKKNHKETEQPYETALSRDHAQQK